MISSRSSERRRPELWPLLCAAALLGCSGSIDEPKTSNAPFVPGAPNAPGTAGRGAPSGASGTGSWLGEGTPPGSGGTGGASGGMQTACTPDPLQATTRIPRLTHAQYDNTVSSLLYLDVQPSAAFLGDPTFAGFDNSAEGLAVADRLGRDYRRAAEELSAQAVGDMAAYRKLVTCSPSAACARQFTETFLRRAFRRAPTAAEVDRYVTLHGMAPSLSAGGDAFVAGVQLVIEAALQSPNFLYRGELSNEVGSEGFIDLNDHEIAARLSYALWNTMPDDTLAGLADAGQLHTPEQVAAQAQRMLDDARAEATVADFHRQWLDLASYEDLLRDPDQFPLFKPELADAMKAETQAFVRHVTFELDQGLHTLLTAPFTFVNRDTAPLYGLRAASYGAEMTKVDLDPEQRAGLLTQLGFLSSHAFFGLSSPIHRGVFIHRRILCSTLPDPPGNANLVLPAIEGSIKTTRQQVEVHTSPDACRSCHHGMINPAGFAFENFDAVGQYRTMDHGEPVDASSMLAIDGAAVNYENAVEFTRAIAESNQARSCYATNWLRYLYARSDSGADRCTIATVARAMADETYSTKDMLADLTRTRAFMQRAPEESP